MGQNTEEKGVNEVKVKLVVVGDCGCGKTTLIKRYINGSYTDVSFIYLFPFNVVKQLGFEIRARGSMLWRETGSVEQVWSMVSSWRITGMDTLPGIGANSAKMVLLPVVRGLHQRKEFAPKKRNLLPCSQEKEKICSPLEQIRSF